MLSEHVNEEIRAQAARKKIKPSKLATLTKIPRSTLWRKIYKEESQLGVDQLEMVAEALGAKAWMLLKQAEENRKETAA
ncbi:hypothetical protein [Arcanobacterium buesumense]|uniref:HTH cro/C1-type domain-containing protein n=1 Tax=Arcanobacterium buesumense TaxID=2722751 RepID=A0A6H2ELT4_9ACTO|nr:hypothetical protein [Arcanobacterium buesumense]QJC22035.1 hypothetical protein HC352_05640 [Arcanobacterium buesumense]